MNPLDEKYNRCVDFINRNIRIRFSHFGFATMCDYSICNRIHGNLPYGADNNIERLERLENGQRLFINTMITIDDCLDSLVAVLERKQIKLIFYIMEEPVVKPEYVSRLLPYTIHMFLMNNVYDHPQIHNLPIGIRDGEEVFPEHQHYTNRFLENELQNERKKKYLCLLAFSYTHLERRRCEDSLGEKSFVTNLNKESFETQPSVHCGKVPVWINFQYTHESDYVLSPSGLGEATHRFFEAIYFDAIPIVKRTKTPFDRLYDVFPCMVVEDWGDVTEELLLEKRDYYKSKLREFKEKYPKLYTDMTVMEELLLLM